MTLKLLKKRQGDTPQKFRPSSLDNANRADHGETRKAPSPSFMDVDNVEMRNTQHGQGAIPKKFSPALIDNSAHMSTAYRDGSYISAENMSN